MSGPYISHLNAHADMIIASLRYLLTCSPLIVGVASASTYCQIIKGFHDIFPYVYEFWHNHLIKYIEALNTQLADEKLVKTVQDLLKNFSCSQDRSVLGAQGSGSNSAVTEDSTFRAESDTLHALPLVFRNYIAHRKKLSSKQSSSTKGPDSSSDPIQTDPTWISAAYRNFQKEYESLLGDAYTLGYHEMITKYHQMAVTSEDIQNFKTRHDKSAYLCRWNGCVWASAGFQSTTEREKHEITHKQQFLCSEPSCDFASNGFASRQALRKHNLKYHTRVEDHALPAFAASESQFEIKSESFGKIKF